jgi:hypothetical protein
MRVPFQPLCAALGTVPQRVNKDADVQGVARRESAALGDVWRAVHHQNLPRPVMHVRPQMIAPSARCSVVRPFSRARSVQVCAERLRLGNLSPAEGSRPAARRKGRGTAAGQVRVDVWQNGARLQRD